MLGIILLDDNIHAIIWLDDNILLFDQSYDRVGIILDVSSDWMTPLTLSSGWRIKLTCHLLADNILLFIWCYHLEDHLSGLKQSIAVV
jgi:hypothetical protein